MKWRVIPFEENDAFINMAIDEAVSESVKKGMMPTIRFYGWKPSAVSIGCFQSLNDDVLQANRRGHRVEATRRAVKLLRQAGFKIHAHWMPNLYGSNPELDIQDYQKMFEDADFRPDELKVYPCSLL